ncbi:MAG: undecaprenyl-phosphate galactose phosphotransferase WbaP [Bryobacteraceae bacterium]
MSDLIALTASVAVSVFVKAVFDPQVEILSYLRLAPMAVVFLAFYAVMGLYSGVAMGPPEEIRRATFSSTLLFLVLAAGTFSYRGASKPFTWTLFLAVALSVILVPLTRGAVRLWLSHRDWWGYPTVIFGAGEPARLVLSAIQQQPGLGLKPVAVIDPESDLDEIEGVPVYSSVDVVDALISRKADAYAIATAPETFSRALTQMVDNYVIPNFGHVLVVPSLFLWSQLWVRPKSLGSVFGLEIPRTSQSNHVFSKRLLDITISGASLVFLAPLFLAIAVAIRMTSRGPVFFGHRRIGQSGVYFQAWKFRTMAVNGDEMLEEYLRDNPAAREEWETSQKLRDDPRVSRVGRLLRRTSLDELPQLWNVLKNDMSLVGPRPIVQAEVSRYGPAFDTYTRVKGGLTGLWQVSGRSDTSYEERVRLDTMYVRNSSVWLDLFILYRTIGVVIFRSGAY